MRKKWYYFKNRKAVGPFEWKKIVELYENNKLIKKSNIWCDDYPEWVTLDQVLNQKKGESVTLHASSFQKQQPPPLPINIETPPPLPEKSISLPNSENKKLNVGPIQTKEDYIASQTITKVSFFILSILGTLAVIGVLSGGFQENTNSTRQASQEWPSSFGFDKNTSFNPSSPSLSQSLLDDIYYSEGFKIGQENSVNVLSNIYPEFSRKLYLAQMKFDSEFGAAYDNIDQVLSSKLSDWNQRKKNIKNSVDEVIEFRNITEKDTKKFLQKINDRINGELPPPVLETLLMFSPKYIRKPHLMFNDGYVKEYRSVNSRKSKEIDLAIQYPSSWKAEEGRRPNIVQKFTSDNGYGQDIVMILIKDFPSEISGKFSEDDILLLKGEKLWNNVSENTTTVDEGSVTLANKPSIWGEFTGSINRTGIEFELHGLGFAMVDKESMIQISFMSIQRKGSKDNFNIDSKFQHLAPTFQTMLNSLDFYDKYK